MGIHFILLMGIQLLSFIFVIIWMTGAIIIVIEFFREYRGKRYEIEHAGRFTGTTETDIDFRETEHFEDWKTRKQIRISRGLKLFITGIVLQIILFIVQKFTR